MANFDIFLSDCPARTTLGIIGNTWVTVVLVALGEEPRRYTALQARIGGISKKMLTQTLRHLENHGLVARLPDRCYHLTELGRTLLDPIAALVRWAEEHTAEMLDAKPNAR